MSTASTASVADPPPAGGAVSGPRPLLGLLARIRRAGMQFALCINRIAQQKVLGQDLSRMAPAGFDATLTNSFVIEAVAWTAALRERVLALAGRPVAPLTPGLPKPARAPRWRRTGEYFSVTYQPDPADRHDWPELAKPLRLGRDAVAAAVHMIAGMSDRAVVTHICDYLQRAAMQLGAEADLPRIAALAEAARALCPEDAAGPAKRAAGSGRPHSAPAAGPSSTEPESVAEADPPKRPADG